MLIIMLAMGAVYPAIDTTAGERENGTWETMMTAATSRENILIAKYLYVATMSFVAGCLNVMAMMFTMRSNIALIGGPAGLTGGCPRPRTTTAATRGGSRGRRYTATIASSGWTRRTRGMW